jgi:hypothetical protein
MTQPQRTLPQIGTTKPLAEMTSLALIPAAVTSLTVLPGSSLSPDRTSNVSG